MNKILMALTFLAAGAGAFQLAQQHANQLEQQAQAAHESWQVHTQQLAAAQSEKAFLSERTRELQQALAQSQPVSVSALWSALQTNRTEAPPPDLRLGLLRELGFDWRTSPDFIVVSKQTVRDLGIQAIREGKLTDLASAVLALMPDERTHIEAALGGITTPLRDWLLAHLERHEPTEELLANLNLSGDATLSQQLSNAFARQVSRELGPEQAERALAAATVKTLAHYSLPDGPKVSPASSNAFATAISDAVGRERAQLILPSAQIWMQSLGLFDRDSTPASMRVVMCQAGNVQRAAGVSPGSGLSFLDSRSRACPKAFRLLFPNGWVDLAKREGIELPPEPQRK